MFEACRGILDDLRPGSYSVRTRKNHLRPHSLAISASPGTDLLVIQALLGHAGISSALVYTHLSRARPAAVTSPLDRLDLGFLGTQLTLEGM
jgi:integrase